MTRFMAALRWDMVLQLRHGFYFASLFVLGSLAGLIWLFPPHTGDALVLLLPAVILLAMIITTYFFVAALMLLEKTEGTLTALVVSPLQAEEYLCARVTSLTLLAVAETMVLVLLLSGGRAFQASVLIPGMMVLAAFLVLSGVLTIVRFDSINEFLIPAAGITFLAVLPLLDHFHIFPGAWWYLHPVQPFLVWVRAGFTEVPLWELLYAAAGSLLLTAAAAHAAVNAFHAFVIHQVGPAP